MRAFLIVWAGQTFSRFGTYMTGFALYSIWMWEETESAAAIALATFAMTAASILAAFIGGAIVDRYSRKTVMIASDTIAGFATLAYLLLFLNNNLQISYIYIGAGVTGFFAQLHGISLSAATSQMIPKKHYSRAGSLRYLTHYGAIILSPPLAGALYVVIGLQGIMLVDLSTVVVAVLTTAFIIIPQPEETAAGSESRSSKWKELTYGFTYIARRRSFIAIMVGLALFSFAQNVINVIHAPLILSRTGDDIGVLAIVGSAVGVGGLVGSVIMSLWGGPERRINGWLLGIAGAGVMGMIFGLGRGAVIWIPAQMISAATFPLNWGSLQAIFLSKVEGDVQGRFFGAQQLVMLIAAGAAQISAGFAGDRLFEPAMQSESGLASLLGGAFGTGAGAGYAVLYFMAAASIVLIAICAGLMNDLRNIEDIVPDYDAQPVAVA